MYTIEEIANILLLSLPQKRYKEEIYQQLKHIDNMDFLYHILSNYPELAVLDAMILYNKIYSDLPYRQWLHLLRRVNSSETALYSIVGFTSRFLGINLLQPYNEMVDVNMVIKQNVEIYFVNREALRRPNKWDAKQVSSLNESVYVFKEINKKLVAEGAIQIEEKFLWEL